MLLSRAPMEVRRLCARKEELFRALRGDCPPATPLGFANLLAMLAKNDVAPPTSPSSFPQVAFALHRNNTTPCSQLLPPHF